MWPAVFWTFKIMAPWAVTEWWRRTNLWLSNNGHTPTHIQCESAHAAAVTTAQCPLRNQVFRVLPTRQICHFSTYAVCPSVRQIQIQNSLPKYEVSSRPDTQHHTNSGRTTGQLEKSQPEPFVNPPLTISKSPNKHNGIVCERKPRCVNVVISAKVRYYRANVLWWPMIFSYEIKSHKPLLSQGRSDCGKLRTRTDVCEPASSSTSLHA